MLSVPPGAKLSRCIKAIKPVIVSWKFHSCQVPEKLCKLDPIFLNPNFKFDLRISYIYSTYPQAKGYEFRIIFP